MATTYIHYGRSRIVGAALAGGSLVTFPDR